MASAPGVAMPVECAGPVGRGAWRVLVVGRRVLVCELLVSGLALLWLGSRTPPARRTLTARPAALAAAAPVRPAAFGPPDPGQHAAEYLQRWTAGDYSGMYDLPTTTARRRIQRDAFVALHRSLVTEAMLSDVQAELIPGAGPYSSRQPFRLRLLSRRLGPSAETNELRLAVTDAAWDVEWQPAMPLTDARAGHQALPSPSLSWYDDRTASGGLVGRSSPATGAGSQALAAGFTGGSRPDVVVVELRETSGGTEVTAGTVVRNVLALARRDDAPDVPVPGANTKSHRLQWGGGSDARDRRPW